MKNFKVEVLLTINEKEIKLSLDDIKELHLKLSEIIKNESVYPSTTPYRDIFWPVYPQTVTPSPYITTSLDPANVKLDHKPWDN
jgi:hypothetical protein